MCTCLQKNFWGGWAPPNFPFFWPFWGLQRGKYKNKPGRGAKNPPRYLTGFLSFFCPLCNKFLP